MARPEYWIGGICQATNTTAEVAPQMCTVEGAPAGATPASSVKRHIVTLRYWKHSSPAGALWMGC
ncbi:hypothetical protein PG990_012851 [Apiospora arundinis]